MDLEDGLKLLIAAGLSAAIFMGLWALWLKTQNPGFKLFARYVGPLPFVFIVLVQAGRFFFAHGTVNAFETYASGPEKGAGTVVKELVFPVEQPELDHVLDVRPALEEVGVKDSNGEPLEVQRAVVDGMVKVEFQARGRGTYKVVLKIPEGVEKVGVVAREVR